jgi:hypothetical protein
MPLAWLGPGLPLDETFALLFLPRRSDVVSVVGKASESINGPPPGTSLQQFAMGT